MRILHLFLVVNLIFNCSQKNDDKRIIEFESVLGINETKTLNILVAEFEKNLVRIYPKTTINEAYHKHLTDIISKSRIDFEKYTFISEKTYNKYRESQLWKEVYYHETMVNPAENSYEIITFTERNMVGKYMQALHSIKGSDKAINEYLDHQQAAGMMRKESFVKGFLSSSPDFNDYFHK